MDGCECSIKIMAVPLKECMAGTTFFGNKHTTAERIIQTMDGCKFSYQNKCSALQRMDDCHSFCDKTRYTVLHGMDGCNWSSELNRLLLKHRMAKISLPKK